MICTVIAHVACKRFFARVSPHVYGQVAQARGTEVAHIAGEGFQGVLQVLK